MEIHSETGGAGDLTVTGEMEYGDNQGLSVSVSSYSYEYTPTYTTYVFEGGTHNYYNNGDQGTNTPGQQSSSGNTVQSYEWTISGDGEYYLSFDETEHYTTSEAISPRLYYNRPNNSGHSTATLTLVLTYENSNGETSTQVRTASILVKAVCGNPEQSADPVVTYEGVTVSWYPTASHYKVYLTTDYTWTEFTEYDEVGDVTSYTFTGLENNTHYYYKIVANCNGSYDFENAYSLDFTTKGEAGLLVYGAVFGGGRMANVSGKTEVAIINCDSIHAVYGGNDIAGVVQGADGATITIGVAANDPNHFDDYGTTDADIRICDVYGGGNGYYAYNGTSFEAASYNTVYHVEPNASILEMTQLHQLGDAVWTNTTSSTADLVCPTITKAKITVTNDYVKIDSLFGGAKNAILNDGTKDVDITIDGGTIFTVFGGNNFGGSLGYKSNEYIRVTHTTTATTGDDYHDGTLGRDFGIGYLFGGGNKVYGQHAHITIAGGQMDTVFGGGNHEDLRSTEVTVNCLLGTYSSETGAFGSVYSDAISSYSSGNLAASNIDGDYKWDRSGIYNIRTLFGGNNKAAMEGVPTLTLTSGGIGTVYGGGNEGDMLAQEETTLAIPNSYGNAPDNATIKYGTHVQLNSSDILIDYLYGGCQKSNVDYSTWLELLNGHAGIVYGGCNISGDVGSTRVNPDVAPNPPSVLYQEVQGGTYVWASGGTVYKNLFAGSNGFYHCNDGIHYIEGIDYCSPENYVGLAIPTHNETHVIVTGNALIKGNVYAGGNMSPVGFTDATVGDRTFPQFVGLASLRMNGGVVHGNVFGGGNMASILGSNEVMVSGGSIGMSGTFDGALYGGNDRSGQVGQISNRVFPSGSDVASDGHTSLTDVSTYVSLTGTPDINTVYGGGNGFYDYANGDEVIPAGHYCSYDSNNEFNDKPIQTNTFVDININGFPAEGGGHINTVYGGGDGVTVYGSIQVLLNVKGESGALPLAYDHVGTIFGGNNRDNVVEHDNAPLVPDIILLQGQVGTVYGGCNMGAMTTGKNFTIGGNTYENVGSMVRLRSTYTTEDGHTATPTAVVSNAVYGGCRMNDVTYNSLVIVEGGTHPANMFGGSDISGTINGTSQVVVTGGTTGNIYGGGNGDYIYTNNNVYTTNNDLIASGTAANPITAPICANSQVDILGGQIGTTGDGNGRDVFGGGYGHETSITGNVVVNVTETGSNATHVFGNVYGGSALGSVNTYNNNNTTTVNILGGTLHGDIFGGGLGQKTGYNGDANILATVNGKVYVNIGATDGAANPTYTGDAILQGNVYGCNNYNGSPKDEVYVNVYATHHGNTVETNHYPTTAPTEGWNVTTLAANAEIQKYAINAVFGGGNLAAYQPEADKKSTVHVYGCLNTVKNVFGGGNAADVGTGNASTLEVTRRTDTYVIIEGGRFNRVIGGGNGEDLNKPAANIFGTANTTVYAGLIDEVYGGANIQGSVDAINLVMSNAGNSSLSNCTDEVYGKVFGCANAADHNRSVTTTVLCGVGEIGELYGGSNLANIGTVDQYNADVTLNLYGGEHTQVFAGSKGDLETLPGNGHTNKASNIYGNVTLNLYGGKVIDAYGGCNYNGNIAGKITVNVIDVVNQNCTYGKLDVTNVYGASNLAEYNPTFTPTSGTERISPVVNVIHIDQTDGIKGNVYGGGNAAKVTNASPQVNIGDYTGMIIPTPIGYTEYPIAAANRRGYVKGNVFGGGNREGVTGNPVINMRAKGTVVSGIYGGCNDVGTVTGNINVNIYGGTLGTSTSSRMTEGIFGGGKGHATATDGYITVTVDKETSGATAPTIYADIYGGSALGEVGAANTTAKIDFKDGTLYGTLYGGGMGEGTTAATAATVTGNTEVAISGGTVKTDVSTVKTGVYGGCNVNGIVLGKTKVNLTGGTVGAAAEGTEGEPGYVAEVRANVYGGGLGEITKVKGDVEVTVDGASVNVYGDVYGGSAKGKVNCNENGDGANEGSKTEVTLTNGTIHGDLYGGGHGPDGENAHVYGPVTVAVNGSGAEVENVFGCNNQSGAPQNTVTVNISDGTINSVFGGGNVAAYTYTTGTYPRINITGGEVTHKVVGGGSAANVTGNPYVNISGGILCTSTTGSGVYGGCYSTGIVDGNILIDITGSTTSQTQIGTQVAINENKPVSVHGGGYGDGTSTTGNVTVNFGFDDGSANAECDYPMLYGDLYGGSALGTVNDGVGDDRTTVNVCNGSFVYNRVSNNVQYGGNIYGGGLGLAGTSNVDKGQVNGEVHVNIGNEVDGNPRGKANLKGCNVFGCNNTNGSPKKNVYVDVYQTKHTNIDLVDFEGDQPQNYAIRNVYGGGNQAHYNPNNAGGIKKVHNTIHYCDNTIENVYGGGNAADTYGTEVVVEGGRFKYIFGGGNGQSVAANIGDGGVTITIYSGHVGWYFSGCNLHGTIGGGDPVEHYGCEGDDCPCNNAPLEVERYYFGANEALTVSGLNHTINCGDQMDFKYVYAGSRLAVVYGDITLTVRGGNIENLFGGNEGSDEVKADVRKYPEDWRTNPGDYDSELIAYLNEVWNNGTDLAGTGGNVTLILEGGTLGNVYGGNDFRGNIEGDITIIVDSTQTSCRLDIDYIYGGNRLAAYVPDSVTVNGQNQAYLTNRISPKVYLKNGHVNYDVFGGSAGGDTDHHYGNGFIMTNPLVVIGDSDNSHPEHKARVGRDVFGGGSAADMEGNTKVVLQGKATVGNNVFGGAKSGNVEGNTDVDIAPATPEPTPATPIPTYSFRYTQAEHGTITVTNNGNPVTSGTAFTEGTVLTIVATPDIGYYFSEWIAPQGGVADQHNSSTTFTIGRTNATLTAIFTDTAPTP